MAVRFTGASRPLLALAVANMALAACGSTAPTAPSPLSTSAVTPAAVSASASPAPVSAGAEAAAPATLTIKQGTLTVRTLSFGSVALRGSHGFRLEGQIVSGLEPVPNCGPFDPCQPGATVPFTISWVGTDIPGTAHVLGKEYPIGSLVTGSLYIELAGSFVAPAHTTDTASVTVPFTASGLLSRGYPLPQLPLTGGGAVTFTLVWEPVIGGWAIRFSSFDFGNGRPADN